ncbi:MAG: bifunctional DNA primase/polymerase, partial [Verrucomicrobiaceae bacterium]
MEAGISTFPCNPKNKKPECRSWRPKASNGQSRPLTLDEGHSCWISLKQRAQDMMVGLDCEVLRVVVIDLDRNKGERSDSDGVAEFQTLCDEHGIERAHTVLVTTPSGGQHLYFADPDGRWGNSTSALAPGIDTRGV